MSNYRNMRVKKFFQPLWDLQREELLAIEKLTLVQEDLNRVKSQVFSYQPERATLRSDEMVLVVDPYQNIAQVYTEDEYEKRIL